MNNSYYLSALLSFENNGGYISSQADQAMDMKKAILPRMRELSASMNAEDVGCMLACEFNWLSCLHFHSDTCQNATLRHAA